MRAGGIIGLGHPGQSPSRICVAGRRTIHTTTGSFEVGAPAQAGGARPARVEVHSVVRTVVRERGALVTRTHNSAVCDPATTRYRS